MRSELTSHELLRQYAEILQTLIRRGVIRTLNAPAGDLAETLVAKGYDGTLAPNSEKSWDVRSSDGRRLQVKSRVVASDAVTKPIQFSIFRSWDFEAAVLIVLSAETYDVLAAFEFERETLQSRASESAWVGGQRVTHSLSVLKALPGAIDVTERIARALRDLP